MARLRRIAQENAGVHLEKRKASSEPTAKN
jgi:hypothetical protein